VLDYLDFEQVLKRGRQPSGGALNFIKRVCCYVCGQSAAFCTLDYCGACRSVPYCSRACQV